MEQRSLESLAVSPQSKDEQPPQGHPCILELCLASLGFAPSDNVSMASKGSCILIVHPYLIPQVDCSCRVSLGTLAPSPSSHPWPARRPPPSSFSSSFRPPSFHPSPLVPPPFPAMPPASCYLPFAVKCPSWPWPWALSAGPDHGASWIRGEAASRLFDLRSNAVAPENCPLPLARPSSPFCRRQ